MKTTSSCLKLPLKPSWHREGMFAGPHPVAWGPGDGLFILFSTRLPWEGVLSFSTWVEPKERRLKATSGGVYCVYWSAGFPRLYECGQTDWTPLCFELYNMFACVYYKRARVFEVDEWPKDFKPAQWMWLILDFKAYTTTIIYRIYIYMCVCRG